MAALMDAKTMSLRASASFMSSYQVKDTEAKGPASEDKGASGLRPHLNSETRESVIRLTSDRLLQSKLASPGISKPQTLNPDFSF